MSIATASDFEVAPTRPLLRPLISATACVALADWLFYGWQIGISLALFFGVLGVVAVASNRGQATRNNQIAMSALFVAGLLPPLSCTDAVSSTRHGSWRPTMSTIAGKSAGQDPTSI